MQTKTNNRRKINFRAIRDNVAPFAVILGSIAGYFGFLFDINALLATGALVTIISVCPYMEQPKTKGSAK